MRWIGLVLVSLASLGAPRAQIALDSTLAAELAVIHERDQGGRFEWRRISQSFGGVVPDSVRTAHWEVQDRLDAENLVWVDSLIAVHGWIGRSMAGEDGASTAFLVIQHAPLETQERYLPLLQAAVTSGESEAWQLAMLTDRVLVRRGLPQRYGTQYSVDPATGERSYEPMEDPSGLNARLAAIGLPPVSSDEP